MSKVKEVIQAYRSAVQDSNALNLKQHELANFQSAKRLRLQVKALREVEVELVFDPLGTEIVCRMRPTVKMREKMYAHQLFEIKAPLQIRRECSESVGHSFDSIHSVNKDRYSNTTREMEKSISTAPSLLHL